MAISCQSSAIRIQDSGILKYFFIESRLPKLKAHFELLPNIRNLKL